MSKKAVEKEESSVERFALWPTEHIMASDTNPRTDFNEADLKELAESIKQVGIINPITVRNLNDHIVEIISGERRWRAAKMIGISHVPVIIRDLTDEQVMEVQIVENLQRKDVHPLDEAAGYSRLIESGHYNEERISEKVGKSLAYIYKRLSLNKCINGVVEQFRAGQMSLAVAAEFARINPEQQAEAFKTWNSWGEYAKTAKEIKNWITKRFFLKLSDAAFSLTDEKLVKQAGSCINCYKRTKYNALLFDDIGDDNCLDPKCWDEKFEAFRAFLKKKYKGKLWSYNNGDNDFCLDPNEYTELDESDPDFSCPDKFQAVVYAINPWSDCKVGDKIWVVEDSKLRAYQELGNGEDEIPDEDDEIEEPEMSEKQIEYEILKKKKDYFRVLLIRATCNAIQSNDTESVQFYTLLGRLSTIISTDWIFNNWLSLEVYEFVNSFKDMINNSPGESERLAEAVQELIRAEEEMDSKSPHDVWMSIKSEVKAAIVVWNFADNSIRSMSPQEQILLGDWLNDYCSIYNIDPFEVHNELFGPIE